jgi:hypothetical protein
VEDANATRSSGCSSSLCKHRCLCTVPTRPAHTALPRTPPVANPSYATITRPAAAAAACRNISPPPLPSLLPTAGLAGCCSSIKHLPWTTSHTANKPSAAAAAAALALLDCMESCRAAASCCSNTQHTTTDHFEVQLACGALLRCYRATQCSQHAVSFHRIVPKPGGSNSACCSTWLSNDAVACCVFTAWQDLGGQVACGAVAACCQHC